MNQDQNCQEEKFKLFKQSQNSKPTISRVHKDVIAVLRTAGYADLEFEKIIENESSLSVDVYIPSKNIGFEVNGNTHYVPGPGGNWDSLNTASLMKYGFLWEIGYPTLPVNSNEWNRLKGIREKENFFNKIFSRMEFYC